MCKGCQYLVFSVPVVITHNRQTVVVANYPAACFLTTGKNHAWFGFDFTNNIEHISQRCVGASTLEEYLLE